MQSDLSAALTAYVGSIPVAITYAPASAAAGLAFNTSVQFRPNNQLSAQASTSIICDTCQRCTAASAPHCTHIEHLLVKNAAQAEMLR